MLLYDVHASQCNFFFPCLSQTIEHLKQDWQNIHEIDNLVKSKQY